MDVAYMSSRSIGKTILLNLNLMTPSVRHGTGDRAQRRALITIMHCPTPRACVYVCVCPCVEPAERSPLITGDKTKRLKACEMVRGKCKV